MHFKKINFYIFYYTTILLFIVCFGFYRLNNQKILYLGEKIRLVQANIPQSLKWDRNLSAEHLKKHIKMSKIPNGFTPNIIIWAESSIPFTLTADTEFTDDNFDYFKDKTLIAGAIKKNEKNNIFNTIFVFENNRVVDFYDKVYLVPFGEYMPIPFLNNFVGFGEFTRGIGNRTITINETIKISPIICYEVSIPNKVVNKKDLPDMIVNLTNDAWFGNTSGPYQHFVAAKFRAIENNMPVLRIANSGISAYINQYGIVEKKLDLNREGIIDLSL